MNHKLTSIRMPRFGGLTGLLFEHGGEAEVVMQGLELMRILEVWEEHEAGKKKPNERIIAALRLLAPEARDSHLRLVAEVPIAQTRAKIEPVIDSETI